MMNWFRELIDGIVGTYHTVTDAVYAFLAAVRFGNVIYLAMQVLFTIFFITTVINMVMTAVSPRVYGVNHRQTLRKVGRNTYWFALLLQLILWCTMPTNTLHVVEAFNMVVAAVIAVLAVLGYLTPAVMMIFARQGKRSFITA